MLAIHPEVAEALFEGRPVVALESAVITHGLPREPLPTSSRLNTPGWDRSAPVNRELARAMQRAVREAAAVPALIAVVRGQLRIGLDDRELDELAEDPDAIKASTSNLAHALTTGSNAGTTGSATLAACALMHAPSALPESPPGRSSSGPLPGVRVFATGGIGGVHRGWQQRPDISADLLQASRTPMCVVCSGAKSLLDIPATLEVLETLGIPVVGYQTDRFPQFYSEGTPDCRAPMRLDDPDAIAALCRAQWRTLGLSTGVLVANPVPAGSAIPHDKMEAAIARAEAKAEAKAITGPARTPYVLAKLVELTHGRSLDANIALLLSNAALAARVADAVSKSS